MGDDTDTPNLARVLASVQARWNIDPTKLLLTGMSDGGTFCYVSGLESASPFTHLAPVSATFHPLMAEMADAERLRGLPVHLVHGKLDWMFPVQVARQTSQALSARLPPVNQFFVDPALRDDADLAARLAAPANENTGVFHNQNEPGSRGGFSLYVPEYYTPDHTWPLVMALHGGSGNGRGFLWSWLRDARSRGAIVITPTATGRSWALTGDDTDTPNLMRILESVRLRWNIDPERMLLTGMSDGGTFCYVTGFDAASPFTHLAPVSATFHPLMAEMADADRLRGLPIHIVHGRLDWMFPVQVARQTSQALSAAGAKVTYRELDDLSHAYPREMNAEILNWLGSEA